MGGHALGHSYRTSLHNKGYVWVHMPDGRRILEHRYVMQKKLGRKLMKGESIHHRDGDRTNNHPDNLELWSKAQPPGQRVSDKIEWAIQFLASYGIHIHEGEY